MSTLGDLADRTIREWLEPPTERVLGAPLNATITDSDPTLTLKAGVLTTEELDAIPYGAILTIGTEWMLVTDFVTATRVATVERGTYGTTAAGHTAGDMVRVGPRFTRDAVVEALKDAIDEISPPLSVTHTKVYSPHEGRPREVRHFKDDGTDYEVLSVEKFVGPGRQGGWQSWPIISVEPWPERGQYGAGVQFHPPYPSGAGHLTFRYRIPRPTLETEELADIGIQPHWERILVVGAVAHLTYTLDLDAATTEWVTEQIERQGFPVTSGARIGNTLRGYRDYLLGNAMAQQAVTQKPVAAADEPVVYAP